MIILAALLLAHLATDFLLQPKAWVWHKQEKKTGSIWLYVHSGLAGVLAYLFTGVLLGTWNHWPILVITAFTHLTIDLWKLYQGDSNAYFFIDQLLHILVIIGLVAAYEYNGLMIYLEQFSLSIKELYHVLFIVFLTFPVGIILSKFLREFHVAEAGHNDLDQEDKSLPKAGLWIGIFERLIIYFLVF